MPPGDPDALKEYDEDTCEDLVTADCPPRSVDYVLGRKISWLQQRWTEV